MDLHSGLLDLKRFIMSKSNGNNLKEYFANVFALMSEHDGVNNKPEVVDELSGEILAWERRDEYCSNYAMIPLLVDGQLTPTNSTVRDKLYKQAQLGKVIVIEYNKQTFTLTPYAGETSHTVVTMGYILRKASKTKLE